MSWILGDTLQPNCFRTIFWAIHLNPTMTSGGYTPTQLLSDNFLKFPGNFLIFSGNFLIFSGNFMILSDFRIFGQFCDFLM
jgi:hypothetical protein